MQNFLLFLLTFCWTLLTLPAFAQNITIDIFGANGLPPQDGECCVYLPRSRNPRDGDDAVRGTPGQNANNLDLELQDNGQALNGHVVVYGTVYGANARQAITRIDQTMNLNASIFINAYGGQGARGGHGGQGQDGCNGADGRDATSSSNGTDGEDGCNSGSGGDAAPAQPGGDGGRVRVYIPANQTHLALLVNANVAGGDGGASGQPGRPGSPGRGGDGGDSHTYISHYENEPACPSSPSGGGGFGGGGGGGGMRDLGNGYDSFESNLSPNLLDFMKDTGRVAGDIFNGLIGVSPAYACGGRRAVYDTNRGGSDGRDGRSGSMGGGITSPGQNGDDGQLEFIVVNPNGSETSYSRPFNLKLLSYDISDRAPGGNGDGIFEPNEILTISNLRVINDSEMPSPRMTDVILSLQTSNWLLANPIDQVVIPSLQGRGQVLLDKVFTVQIKNSFSVGQNQSWSVSDTLVPRGTIPRIQRTQAGLQLPQTVHISFPVEITPIQSVAVIGPGETAEIQWRVSNLSNRDFLGLGGALRTLRTALRRVGGDATATTIQGLRFEGNEQSDESSFLRTITELKANESVIIAGHIDFSDQAQPYTYVDLQSSLGLEILGTRDFSTIMTHGHRITISQTYRYSPDAALVMLTNSRTTREEYNAWMKLYADLGLKADVWDMSYNRDLNLVRDLVDNQKGKSLIQNYQNKTIVLLNNEMAELNSQRALRMLNRSQFFEAASAYNINFYVFGGDESTLTSEIMGMHLSPNRLAPVVGNQERFNQAIASNDLVGPMQLQDSDQMSYLEMHAVLRQRPESNYSLVFTESGRTPKLTLYPSLSRLQGRMIAQPASLRESQASSYIASPKNVRPFVLSLGLEEKVKSYNYLAAAANVNYLPALTSALIHDLVETSYNYSKAANAQTKVQQLAKLQKALSDLQRSDLPSASNEFMARVLAAFSYFASVSEDAELKKIADQLTGSLDQNLKPVFERTFESYKNFSNQRQRALRAGYEKSFDTYKMFTLPAIGRAVTNTNTMFIKSSQVFKAGL